MRPKMARHNYSRSAYKASRLMYRYVYLVVVLDSYNYHCCIYIRQVVAFFRQLPMHNKIGRKRPPQATLTPPHCHCNCSSPRCNRMPCAAGNGCDISKSMPGKVDIRAFHGGGLTISPSCSGVVRALLLARNNCLSVRHSYMWRKLLCTHGASTMQQKKKIWRSNKSPADF